MWEDLLTNTSTEGPHCPPKLSFPMTLTNKQQRFGSHRAETAVCHQNSFLAHTKPDLCLDSAAIPCLALTGPLHRSVQTALHLHVLEPAGPEPAPSQQWPSYPRSEVQPRTQCPGNAAMFRARAGTCVQLSAVMSPRVPALSGSQVWWDLGL